MKCGISPVGFSKSTVKNAFFPSLKALPQTITKSIIRGDGKDSSARKDYEVHWYKKACSKLALESSTDSTSLLTERDYILSCLAISDTHFHSWLSCLYQLILQHQSVLDTKWRTWHYAEESDICLQQNNFRFVSLKINLNFGLIITDWILKDCVRLTQEQFVHVVWPCWKSRLFMANSNMEIMVHIFSFF